MPHRLYLEQFGNVHALPVLHYRMEFAHLVREAVTDRQTRTASPSNSPPPWKRLSCAASKGSRRYPSSPMT